MSKGEQFISNLLDKAHIKYEREKSFVDLKQGRFRFDFFIPNLHNHAAVIEFQGQQHYSSNKYFYKNRQDFLKQKNNDRRKISYCLANNILIYCIPYWELENLHSAQDCFQLKYLATSRWKNDEDWTEYQKIRK